MRSGGADAAGAAIQSGRIRATFCRMTEIHSYLEALMLTDDQPLSFERGRKLFEEGQPSDGRMYIVRTGSVKLRSGQRRLETVGPGGMIGEMALIDPAPRSATALAGADCTVTAVNKWTFDQLVKKVPGLALEMMRILARRLRRTTAARKGPVRKATARKTRARPKARRSTRR